MRFMPWRSAPALAAAALVAAAPALMTAAEPRQDAATAAPATGGRRTPPCPTPRLERLKEEAIAGVDDRGVLIQRMVDSLYSFSELGFQEFETQRYITELLASGGLRHRARRGGHPQRLDSALGFGAPRDRARQRRRRHPAVVADAGSRLPPAARRRRAGARRGPQLGPGGQHRRGARREGHHGTGGAFRALS